MKINAAGFALIKGFEGKRLEAYPDPGTGGEPWTIGYGHTTAAGLPTVHKGLVISQEDADEILARDLEKFEKAVSTVLSREANENQFAAMVSLCFNIGLGNFAKSSVIHKFNSGDFKGAKDSFKLWNKAAGRVLSGLTARRKAEADLFAK